MRGAERRSNHEKGFKKTPEIASPSLAMTGFLFFEALAGSVLQTEPNVSVQAWTLEPAEEKDFKKTPEIASLSLAMTGFLLFEANS